MEVILIIVGIINIILLVKLWGTCNVINAIGDVIIFERENLKGKFIDDVEKLHEEIKDPAEFRKASLELADRYEEKQRIRSNDFKFMLNYFKW
jgi:nucleosome binding factor SPN SPT16 subunit